MSKTASDLRRAGWSAEELAEYHPWDAVERYGKDSELKARKDRALDISRKAAGLLKQKYGATRVVLFGSLAHEAWFTPRSDIDIYTEGIPVKAFFKAEAEVQLIGQGLKVDLIDSKECSPELMAEIEREGIEL
ncbi:MAG: hypothetical protein GY849_03440 [Deltaproteobacteria bacterium]|nr:hypothetical protein [Deltaproteobacteria bacterium]